MWLLQRLVFVCVGILLISGCASTVIGGDTDPDDKISGGDCSDDSDCIGGEICERGTCHEICLRDSSCPEGYLCDRESLTCVKDPDFIEPDGDNPSDGDEIADGDDPIDGDLPPDGDLLDGDVEPEDCEDLCVIHCGAYRGCACGSCAIDEVCEDNICLPENCEKDKDCGESGCDEYSQCGDFITDCSENGRQTRHCSEPFCDDGSCSVHQYNEEQPCQVNRDGKACDMGDGEMSGSCEHNWCKDPLPEGGVARIMEGRVDYAATGASLLEDTCTPSDLGDCQEGLFDGQGDHALTASKAFMGGIPADGHIQSARLIWMGSLDPGSSGSCPGSGANTPDPEVTLTPPGGQTATISATPDGLSEISYLDTDATGVSVCRYYYSYSADVTKILREHRQANLSLVGDYALGGAHVFADAPYINQTLVLGGWSLLLVYSLPEAPIKRIYHYRRFQQLQDAQVIFNPKGLNIPADAEARITFFLGEGDHAIYGICMNPLSCP